jgi:hypothetical protein
MRKFAGLLLALVLALGISAQGASAQMPPAVTGGAVSGQYAGVFDGTDNVITIPATPNLSSPAISVEAWFNDNVSHTTTYGTVLVLNLSSGAGGSFALFNNNTNHPAVYVYTSASVYVNYDVGGGPVFCPAGFWCHIIATYDSVNGLNVYQSSSVENVAANGTAVSGNSTSLIGYQSPTGQPYFNGHIGPIRVWNRALAAGEVNCLISGLTCTTIPSGLIAWWNMSDGAGTSTAVDQGPNGNNGTWSGTQSGTSGYYSFIANYHF